jgi:hypothetical protein
VRTDTVQSERSFLILSTLLNPLRPDFIRSTIFNIDNRQKFVLSTAMRLVAVTRLRIRAARFVLPFGWYTWRSFRQAKNAPGNRGAKVRRAQGFAFWTLTVWENEAAMKDYRIKPPHLQAMARLLEWCDEASVVHWTQESTDLPDWNTAEKRMAECGRLSKVNHPSADQQAGRLDFRNI